MIPVTADDELLASYVANITIAWHAASPDQQQQGRSWYRTAQDLAYVIGDGDIRMGAGLIAALSANKRWELNLTLAKDAAQGDVHGHTKATLDKVRAILCGADPAGILPLDKKTGAFYRCILNPGDPDPVVIDRHAHDIAVGSVYGNQDRGLSSLARYATLSHAYRVAARAIGEIPSIVQAATWVAHVDMLSGTGTRGYRNGRDNG
jgi:hypothetical protein